MLCAIMIDIRKLSPIFVWNIIWKIVYTEIREYISVVYPKIVWIAVLWMGIQNARSSLFGEEEDGCCYFDLNVLLFITENKSLEQLPLNMYVLSSFGINKRSTHVFFLLIEYTRFINFLNFFVFEIGAASFSKMKQVWFWPCVSKQTCFFHAFF